MASHSKATDRQKGVWFLYAMAILFFMVFPLAPSVYSLAARLLTRWHTADGRLLSYEIERKTTSSGHYKIYFHLHVKYSYSVSGRDFQNSQVHFVRSLDYHYDRAEKVKRHIDSLTPGGKVRVYYATRNPSRSCLTFETYIRGRLLMALIGAVIIVCIKIADLLIPTKQTAGTDSESEHWEG